MLQKILGDAPLTLEAKRQLIEKLRSRFDVDLLCHLLRISRSSIYYDTVEDGVCAEIMSIAQEFRAYGLFGN